jgi:RNA polymerase sigma-70 factor (ECF subfamily)
MQPNPADFVSLWSENARRVHAYILTLVRNSADADDVFQETSLKLWEKFNEFEPGTDFGAWASRIAYFEAKNLLRKRSPIQLLDDNLLELLSAETIELAESMDSRFEALNKCVRQLGEYDRNLLDARYRLRRSVKQVAESLGTGVSSVYRDLRKVHRRLFDCIERRIAKAGSDG